MLNAMAVNSSDQYGYASDPIVLNQLHYPPTPWSGYPKVVCVYYQPIPPTLLTIHLHHYPIFYNMSEI